MSHQRSRAKEEDWERVLADLPRINYWNAQPMVSVGDTITVYCSLGEFAGTVITETSPIRAEFAQAFLLDTPAASCWALWESDQAPVAATRDEKRAAT